MCDYLVVGVTVDELVAYKGKQAMIPFEDRIEITSPGGLPQGLDESEYLKGGVSILRNRILGSVFYRLHLI